MSAAPAPAQGHHAGRCCGVGLLPTAASGGFTLIEVLVALMIMTLMALMSWRGIDGMARTQALVGTQADAVLGLQTALAQWSTDLDALLPTGQVSALDWDGRVLRITRHHADPASHAVQVVAWSRRAHYGSDAVTDYWLRWQSPPLTTRDELQQAWAQAARWSQAPTPDDATREVAITPLLEWQIYYFRNDAWSNPLSSAGPDSLPPEAPSTAASAALPAAKNLPPLPDGVRLVLSLPDGAAVSGRLTRDWVRPTLGGSKS